VKQFVSFVVSDTSFAVSVYVRTGYLTPCDNDVAFIVCAFTLTLTVVKKSS
jgi:hypothetical protein